MYDLHFKPPITFLTAFANLAQVFPQTTARNFRNLSRRWQYRLLKIVTVEPGPVVYANDGKLRWDSARQRKAFFASDGFGGGIPHVRKHKGEGGYLDAFHVAIEQAKFSGLVRIENDYPGAEFIGGILEQPFHWDTGWPNIVEATYAQGGIMAEEASAVYYETFNQGMASL